MILMETAAIIISECLSTAVLVICSCLAVHSFAPSVPIISGLMGLTHLLIMNCFGQISGGHGNPAISLSVWWQGIISLPKLAIYVGAQMAGAILGQYAVGIFLNKSPSELTCLPQPSSDLSDINIMLIEFFLTFLTIMCWLAVWKTNRVELRLAALSAVVCMLGFSLTGAYTNPARFLAPMFFSSKQEHLPAYLGGQLLAGLVAPIFWNFLRIY